MCTGVAMRLDGEARKGFRLTMALGPWGGGLQGRRAHRGVAGPCPLEPEPKPHQGDQPQLVEKEIGDHGKTPTHRWCKRGILPEFHAAELPARWRYTTR